MLYWFQLWREFKLSIAELFAVFPNMEVLYSEKSVMLVNGLTDEEIISKADSLWWTIKIFELDMYTDIDSILFHISEVGSRFDSKFNYWLNIFGENKLKLSKMLMSVKKHLKSENISSRFVNKNDVNLSSAQIIWNKIIKRWADFNIVDLDWIYYFGRTIWVQDIDAYSARDYWKSRDMDIWMLPPKLSQMMINISKNWSNEIKSLYDPFVWLGTILIEWAYMWIKNLFWSDFNPKMVQESKSNLWNLKSKFSSLNINIIEADARDMKDSPLLAGEGLGVRSSIVTEWFLWEVMTQKNVNMDRINIQKKNLSKLYEKFFSGLKSVWFEWNIVISFPFWDIKWKYVFFTEIYNILNEYCEIISLFPSEFNFSETKSWSLLYKRDKQLVWREIFKLKIK